MKFAGFTIIAGMLTAPVPAIAQSPLGATDTVRAFSDALIATMRDGPALGFSGRSARLAPVIERSFDLDLATRLSIGPEWSRLSASDQTALTGAIRRMTVAEYARNFARWNGEAILVDPRATSRGNDALVRTTLTRRSGDPVVLAYRLRQAGGKWRIIDVLFNGSVSQLATRRADYARILNSGGAPALVRHLDKTTANAAR